MSEIEIPTPDPTGSLKREKRVVLGVMLLLTAVFAALDSIYYSVPGWDRMLFMLDSLSSAFCLSMWCGCDARMRGFRLGRGMRWAIILVAIIAFPVYAFSSRGRRGWALLGLSALFFMLLMAVSAGAGWAADMIMNALDSGDEMIP